MTHNQKTFSTHLPKNNQIQLAIIGLGYVGLPLAIEFSQYVQTIGFDINPKRINKLKQGQDDTQEVSKDELKNSRLILSSDTADIKNCNTFIITVPTPINIHKQPNLSPLKIASQMVSQCLAPGNVVIYESTVYPGATNEVCVPILEEGSKLTYNKEFFVGYSPERINPGDTAHKVRDIMKVTAGSCEVAADWVDELYQKIITAGTFKASSIQVAEAAKVIENTQRDVNIALINELAQLFNRLNIDTQEVLAAAATKWNFLPFQPGLVGGHCISVDPYYLTHKAQAIGHHPDVILAGRRINDEMGYYVAQQLVQLMLQNKQHVADAHILVLGLAFKENCPDLRNSRVIDVIQHLQSYHAQVAVYDPWITPEEALSEYRLALTSSPKTTHYDAIILCVAHDSFLKKGVEWIKSLLKPGGVFYDVKAVFPKEAVDGRL